MSVKSKALAAAAFLALAGGIGFATSGTALASGPVAPHQPIWPGLALPAPGSAPVTPAAAPQVQICTGSISGYPCLNRNGGGTGNGTKVILYTQNNSNNDFTFGSLSTYCGAGKVTSTCPFVVGSGLNTRYQGSFIYELFNYDTFNCAVDGQPASPGAGTVLAGCGATGYIWVESSLGFTVNVAATNDYYNAHGQADPQWLTAFNQIGTQTYTGGVADDTWGCVGSGIGSC